VRAAADSVGTLWLEGITLPGIALGALQRGLKQIPAVPASAARFAALLALPVIASASSFAADALMAWSFRPALAALAARNMEVSGPITSEYLPPPPEELLGSEATNARNSREHLLALLPPDFDALDRARLVWALDGDPNTEYPMPDVAAVQEAGERKQ
jgi:hypothetical protein